VNVQEKSSVSEMEKTIDAKDKCSKPRGANETIPVHKPSWRTSHSGKVPHRRGKQDNLIRREGESDRTHDDDNEDVHSVGCDRADIPDQILGYQRHQADEIVDRYEKEEGPNGGETVCAIDLNSLVDNGEANCENQDANEDDKMAHVVSRVRPVVGGFVVEAGASYAAGVEKQFLPDNTQYLAQL